MNKNRIARINDEILHETANIIRSEIKDPRVSTLVVVTKVDTTTDLSHCKIHVSILGEDSAKKEVLEGLRNASGFIRKLLAERINLRQTPNLNFLLDDSLLYGMHLSALIDDVTKKDKEAREERADSDEEQS